MMWSCLQCSYLYEVVNRSAAEQSQCPKCAKYQTAGVSFARDLAEGQWNPAKGFFFGSPFGKGIVKGIFIVIVLVVIHTILEHKFGLGKQSQRYVLFTFGAAACATLSHWYDASVKRNSTSGYCICALFYGIIGLGVASAKGMWWGIFWFVYVYWDGFWLLVETVKHRL